jgi:hypothetical protein
VETLDPPPGILGSPWAGVYTSLKFWKIPLPAAAWTGGARYAGNRREITKYVLYIYMQYLPPPPRDFSVLPSVPLYSVIRYLYFFI